MRYSGNIIADMQDEAREIREKEDQFICQCCHQKSDEDYWDFNHEVCLDCLADYLEEINHKQGGK